MRRVEMGVRREGRPGSQSIGVLDDGSCLYLDAAVCGNPERFMNAVATTSARRLDCDGNVVDVCGVCGGDGTTCPGCTNPFACNYNPTAGVDDGSCDFCSCSNDSIGSEEVAFPLIVSSAPSVVPGMTVYRFYVQMQTSTDRLSAVFGDAASTLFVSTPDGVFNSDLNGSWNASGLNPAFVGIFPELADDSFATIGLDGPASQAGATADDR